MTIRLTRQAETLLAAAARAERRMVGADPAMQLRLRRQADYFRGKAMELLRPLGIQLCLDHFLLRNELYTTVGEAVQAALRTPPHYDHTTVRVHVRAPVPSGQEDQSFDA